MMLSRLLYNTTSHCILPLVSLETGMMPSPVMITSEDNLKFDLTLFDFVAFLFFS